MNATRNGEDVVFDAARELAGHEERSAYLDGACGGDSAFRARIEELLAAEAEAEKASH